MARIKLGPLITDISGSIGMATIQRNQFGHTLRLKPLQKKSATPAQTTIRLHLITIQKAWQALEVEERLQWNRFINFSGQTIRKDNSVLTSGYNLYLTYQLYHLLNGQPLYTTIQYAPLPDMPVLQELSWSPPWLYVGFTAEVDPAKLFFILKLGHPGIVRQKYNLYGLRFMKAPWSSSADFDIAAPFLAAFGAIPPEYSWLSYSFRYFSTVSPVLSGVFTGSIHCIYE